MKPPFHEWLHMLQQERASDMGLWLSPTLGKLPLVFQRYDEPLFPFTRTVIEGLKDSVCAFVFDLASYLALGAAGIIALERSAALASGHTITILHGPFTRMAYVEAALNGSLAFDAVTVTHADVLGKHTIAPHQAIFIEVDSVSGAEKHDVYLAEQRSFILGAESANKQMLTIQTLDPLATAMSGDSAAAFLVTVRQRLESGISG